jgi:TRAP-type C4-dicarboxylate transport system permease small subunit
MTMIERLNVMRDVVRKVSSCLCFGGMFLLLPMMFLTTVDVVGRAVWAWPIIGGLEISSFMLAMFVLSALAYTQQKKGHVRVSMVLSRLPERLQLILEASTTILSLFVIAIMTWQGWALAVRETAVSDMLRIPQWPFRLLVSVAGFFLFLELLIDLAQTGQRLFKR